MLTRSGIAVMALLVALGAFRASAQIEPYTPPQAAGAGADWTERIVELLPEGVETRSEARGRLVAYESDPVQYPVPRTSWDGKPDFSGVYWPDATVTRPPVPLESLYRPEVREYREGGGAAVGLIDWQGIDTPNSLIGGRNHPTGVSPGIPPDAQRGPLPDHPIVGENEPQPSASHKPSFQGSSVGHWEGDTLVVDFGLAQGVYWLRPPVPLESLYRPEVREYREGGGAAVGLIDWQGIDTPNYHCWPRSGSAPEPSNWCQPRDTS